MPHGNDITLGRLEDQIAWYDTYAGSTDGTPLLADRIEGLISQEHAKWVSAREEAERAIPGGDK